MFRTYVGFLLAIAMGVSGCSSQPVPSSDAVATDGHADHAGHDHQGADAENGVTLAGLTVEDQKLAAEQKICPVTGELLGSMGMPPKVDVNGRQVFICCEGCRDKLLADPETYLAKLK